MGYTAKGSVELTSTVKMDGLVIDEFESFLKKNKLTVEDINDNGQLQLNPENKNAFKVLVAFVGFDLSDCEFKFASKLGTDEIYHALRLNGRWNDHEVRIVLEYFTSLGMGILGEFVGEDGLNWEYKADFRSKVLKEEDLEKIPSNEILDLNENANTLEKIAKIIGLSVEDLTLMVDSGEFAHRNIFSRA